MGKQESLLESRNKVTQVLMIVVMFLIGQGIVSLFFDLPFQPLTGADTGRYTSGGSSFPNLNSTQWGYFGYCFLFWVDNSFNASGWFVVLIQVFASIGAANLLWRLGEKISSRRTGAIAAGFFLLNPLVSQWTRYLLTEALFFSAVIALLASMYSEVGANPRPRWVLIALLLAFSMRPNGFVLIPIVCLFLIAKADLTRGIRWVVRLIVVAVTIAAIVLLPSLQSGGGGESNSFAQRASRGEVFWNSNSQAIKMPPLVQTNPSNLDFIGYALENPVQLLRLGLTRLLWETAQVRPWYSNSLNLFAATSTGLLALGLVLGLRRAQAGNLNQTVALLSLPSMLLVAATWAIDEGRFGWWYMVTWIPVAAMSADRIIGGLHRRARHQVRTSLRSGRGSRS